jgi:D-alanyl-D-alanine carboxypeptidase
VRPLSAIVLAAALVAVVPSPAGAASLTGDMRAVLRAGAPGVIVFARHGSRTQRLAAGVGDRSHRTPIRVSDRFRIGSVTKTFVAALVLQLVEQGRLSLDDTVERWLPGLVPNGGAITVRHLLSHTSGIFDYLNDGDDTVIKPYLGGHLAHVWTERGLVGVATGHPPNFAPGAKWSYSNTGYVLLGLVVEAVSGDTLASQLSRRLFEPLGLRHSSLDTTGRISGAHAHGYLRFGKQPLVDVTPLSPTIAWGAGGIVSTAGDVAQFYRALLGGRVVGADPLRAMETTVPMGPTGESYGLGLWNTRTLGLTPTFRLRCAASAWGHDGDFPGYVTWAFNSRDGSRQVVVGVNDDTLTRRAQQAVARLVGDAFCS